MCLPVNVFTSECVYRHCDTSKRFAKPFFQNVLRRCSQCRCSLMMIPIDCNIQLILLASIPSRTHKYSQVSLVVFFPEVVVAKSQFVQTIYKNCVCVCVCGDFFILNSNGRCHACSQRKYDISLCRVDLVNRWLCLCHSFAISHSLCHT